MARTLRRPGEPLPRGLRPMLARAGDLPRDDVAWAYEVKWDGVRGLVSVQDGEVCACSRTGREITPRYPEIEGLPGALDARAALLDGELVAFDTGGRPSFEALQRRMHVDSRVAMRRLVSEVPVTLVLFDVLHLDGASLLGLPYRERRAALESLGIDGPSWRTPGYHAGDGEAMVQAVRVQGLEGVVAKRLESVYEPGRRSGAWLKIKRQRSQELVIGGWAAGEGRRRGRIGALLVGYHDEEGALRFAGRVGTGFGEAELDRLATLLSPLRRGTSPFAPPPAPPRGAVWVQPALVAQVEFTEWTRAGTLRHPAYKGLRDDREPRDIVREPMSAP